MTPPASDTQIQHQQQQQRMQAPKPQIPHGLPGNQGLVGNTGVIGTTMGPKGQGSSGTGSTGGTPLAAAYYPSPFQNMKNHIEQLGKLTRPLLSHFF
jgi:hypothetical protein